MKAQILKRIQTLEENPNPLELVSLPVPKPKSSEVLVKVLACGVCHTELDEIEGRTPPTKLPIILGHQIVGKVVECGSKATKFKIGDRVGIAWINSACGKCSFCRSGYENLCPEFRATGRDVDGGYAEYTLIDENFAYPIPKNFTDLEACPLLCAGVIGFRALRLTGLKNGDTLGLFGFGASAHIVIQIVKYQYPNSKVFVFTRTGQIEHQTLAKELGADWVGSTGDLPPEKIKCAIDFTPAWRPIVEALRVLERGGRVVINAIRKEAKDKGALQDLDYADCIWLEKEIKSVANVTRGDAQEFLPLAAQIPIKPKVIEFKLEEANQALNLLKAGKIKGAAVLKIG
uniref:alcohol dehydrogenase n=1 Tax=candidate division WOR-3 bacterium TaxID=2052148 RepID=A0A7C6AAJ1_UNCW3